MKRFSKRLLSLLLVCALLVSVSAFALAEGDLKYKQFNKYCSIGDSVAYAIYYDDQPGTFPRLVRNAVGCEDNYVFFNHCGMRAKDMLVALNCAELDDSDPYYASGGPIGLMREVEVKAPSGCYEEMITSSDLITLELGLNDVIYAPSTLLDMSSLDMSSGMPDPAGLTDLLTQEIELTYAAYEEFLVNYPMLVERIQELKQGQDYTLVLVGVFNPCNNINLSDDILLPVGDAISLISSMVNARIKEWAEKYGCKYVDISNVETGAMRDSLSLSSSVLFELGAEGAMASHPSYPEGYAYIARQVLNTLEAEPAEPDMDIRIDLGPVKSVASVAVGIDLLNKDQYSFDPATHILTVKSCTPFATSVAVTAIEDGKLATYIYSLKYTPQSGYQAYLIYQAKDVSAVVHSAYNNLRMIGSAISTAIRGLFTK